METNIRVGTRVIVSADLTGDGSTPKGFVSGIEDFAGDKFYNVTYIDRPGGTFTTNPGLLTPINC